MRQLDGSIVMETWLNEVVRTFRNSGTRLWPVYTKLRIRTARPHAGREQRLQHLLHHQVRLCGTGPQVRLRRGLCRSGAEVRLCRSGAEMWLRSGMCRSGAEVWRRGSDLRLCRSGSHLWCRSALVWLQSRMWCGSGLRVQYLLQAEVLQADLQQARL
ncbi:MAG: hypothetical protein AB7O38_06970 [Pirellulaceae bacterium]